ncbi:methyltransferase domain-containing protein [Propylenella binzhouense]|uniref:Methyltransferase domain-containing protein n=1 Tax=Propylenella binzhouense TaxID=2555902 RepID=A0A964WV66_9HYPH|nr:methyltransferase domain-containing protein [Propylenella binzhouense]MYZ49535.1 methyltransferase domain-containing protein [Propylenella binzhouense]
MSPIPVTDKAAHRRRLARALRLAPTGADFLALRAAGEIADRLAVVERRFGTAIVSEPAPVLADALAATGRLDALYRLAPVALAPVALEPVPGALGSVPAVVGDEEALPFAEASIDLFASLLTLHWANDLPGALVQIRRALRPDGLFLAALLGGETLAELRRALTEAEAELQGGASPRVLPFADVRDLGALLQRAGFALPVADRDVVTVRYGNAFELMLDLRRMGATNVLAERDRRVPPRRLFLRAAEIYAHRFGDPDGRVRATFEVISLSGWAPDESQPKPARRGSATISLAHVLADRGRAPD